MAAIRVPIAPVRSPGRNGRGRGAGRGDVRVAVEQLPGKKRTCRATTVHRKDDRGGVGGNRGRSAHRREDQSERPPLPRHLPTLKGVPISISLLSCIALKSS